MADESATAYASGRAGGRSAAGREEVWLRGNVRPVVGVGVVALGGSVMVVGAAVAAGAGPRVMVPLALVTAAVAVAVVALARAADGLRLGRRGDRLLLRLSPWRTDAVPLAVVECVFPGSRPLAGPVVGEGPTAEPDGAGPPAARRVGTLVIRFAERAREWRERPTVAAWGSWHDGHAVLDGRWCEPLTAEVARAIGQRLLEAKREAAVAEPTR